MSQGQGKPNRRKTFVTLLLLASAIVVTCFLIWSRSSNRPTSSQQQQTNHPGLPHELDDDVFAETASHQPPSSSAEPATSHSPDRLWRSPTSGSPIELSIPLDGTQFILSLHLGELWQQTEFVKSWRGLGPSAEEWLQGLEHTIGLNRNVVQHLLIMAAAGDDPDGVDVTALATVAVDFSIPRSWKKEIPPTAVNERAEFYRLSQLGGKEAKGYLVRVSPTKSDGVNSELLFVPDSLAHLINSTDHVPLLARDLERLRLLSDIDRQLTLITNTQFLAAHGHQFMELMGGSRLVKTPWLRDTNASLLSGEWREERFFVEFISAAPWEFADQLAQRFAEAGLDWVDQQRLNAKTWRDQPRLRQFADRWHTITQFTWDHMRIGHRGDLTVVNLCLPLTASHNLFCGIRLARFTADRRSDVSSGARRSSNKWTQLLDSRVSFSVDQASLSDILEKLESLAQESMAGAAVVKLRIDGAALEKAGIARNQQLREFRANETKVANVLINIARIVGSSASEPGQHDVLVWVYPRDSSANRGALVATLTTREMATQLEAFTTLAPN